MRATEQQLNTIRLSTRLRIVVDSLRGFRDRVESNAVLHPWLPGSNGPPLLRDEELPADQAAVLTLREADDEVEAARELAEQLTSQLAKETQAHLVGVQSILSQCNWDIKLRELNDDDPAKMPPDDVFNTIRRAFRRSANDYGLRLTDCANRLVIEAGIGGGAGQGGSKEPAADYSHSEDYRSVNWYGQKHTFTTRQAAIVQSLWEAWERGTPALSKEHLLECAGSCGQRVDSIFREAAGRAGKNAHHKAWHTMIVAGDKKGTYRLNQPA